MGVGGFQHLGAEGFVFRVEGSKRSASLLAEGFEAWGFSV